MKYNNLVVTTVTCDSHPNDEHHFCSEDKAPSQALHEALMQVPCTGSYSVAMSVLEFDHVERGIIGLV